ncbi:MAG: HEAT repeat domain-containing protein [Candidatus Latescibacterota bacterium]|nr:MAG: HEAT repeat domain-containing protein [Candidatus Latescibacterota bacterium]
MMRMLQATSITLLLLATTSLQARTDALEDAAREVQNGKLRFLFAARAGVWGDGGSVLIMHPGEVPEDDHGWRGRYEPGPVRVTLTLRDAEVVRVKRQVGGRWGTAPRGTRDLGSVPALLASQFLMTLAFEGHGQVAEDALAAAVLAAGVDHTPQLRRLAGDRERPLDVRKSAIFWFARSDAEGVAQDLVAWIRARREPREIREHAVFALSQRPQEESVAPLLAVARDHEVSREVRKQAVFWLGQAVGDAVTADLNAFVRDDDEDVEIRKHAVFALSQRPADQSVPALLRVARSAAHPELRESAIFWLSQVDDPRVVDFFEEILFQEE